MALTFNVTIGKDRRLVRIGKYPEISLSEARRRAHEIIANKDVSRITFDAARDLFFSSHLDTLKASTAHEQKNLMRRFPFSKALASITAQDVQRVLDDMPRGSARSCFNVIRTFFNWAVANEHITTNPLKRSPYKAKSRDRLLTDDEISLIWGESYNHNGFGVLIRSLLLSGQRLNQIARLDKTWMTAPDTLQFPAYIMKSNTDHIIPLTPCLEKELHHHQPIKSLSTPMNTFRQALPQIPHWTLHDFRRYFSSMCAKLKIPIDITEAILNHTTGSRTAIQRVYDRFDRLAPMRSALETYQEHVLKLVERTQEVPLGTIAKSRAAPLFSVLGS